MEYHLAKNDIEDLTMLTNFTEELYDTYEALYNLELSGKKDSDEYKRKLERIKDIIALSSTIEARLTTSKEKILCTIHYLYKKINMQVPKGIQLIYSVPSSQKELIISRMINHLAQKYFKIPSKLEDLDISEERLQKLIMLLGGNSMESITDLMNFINYFQLYYITDVASIVTVIIDEYMKNQNKELEKQVLWSKYGYSFLFDELEKNFVQNGQLSEEHPFLLQKSARSLYKTPEIFEKDLLFKSTLVVLTNVLPMIIKVNTDITQPREEAKALVGAANIRATLIMLDEKDANKMIAQLEELISELEKDDSMSKASEILKSAISNRNKDVNIPQIVSFTL